MEPPTLPHGDDSSRDSMAERSRSRTPSAQGTPHPLLQPSPVGEDFSVLDLLKEQSKQEEEAARVLPFSFNKCTWPTGPGVRQPIYACLTCNPKSGERVAGVCAACSVQCHGDHDLVELFSRRNFVCDCGSDRLGPTADCALSGRKATEGAQGERDNAYDHAFRGEFCVCEKGMHYDPEREEEDMYQCVVCEDWRHASCLGPHPHPDDWDSLICASCVASRPVLHAFLQRWAGAEGSGVMICIGDGEANIRGRLKPAPSRENGLATVEEGDEDAGDAPPASSSPGPCEGPVVLKRGRSPSAAEGPATKRARLDLPPTTGCIAPRASGSADYLGRANAHQSVYLAEGWRDRWCLCRDCRTTFDELPFLVDEEEEWEAEEDEDSKKSLFDLGMNALSAMPRDQAIDRMLAYQNLRDQMMQFLKPFAEAKQVVTREAVEDFFERQRETLRQGRSL